MRHHVYSRPLHFEEYVECCRDALQYECGAIEYDPAHGTLMEMSKSTIEYKVQESNSPAVRMAFDIILDGVRVKLWFTNADDAAIFKLKWG